MGRELTPYRIAPLTPRGCPRVVSCGISTCFQVLSPCMGQIVHALLTRPPLESYLPSRRTSNKIPVRLACVKHAASVRPEPGSNSDVQSFSMSLPSTSHSPKQLASVRNTAFYSQLLTVLFALSLFAVSFSRIALPHFRFFPVATMVIIAIASNSVKRFWQLHLDITQNYDILSHKKFIYERYTVIFLQ